jgi:hypothetical protein
MEEKHSRFISRLSRINEEFDYDYCSTIYGTRMDKIEVICNKHGPFIKSVQQLERGLGCPVCIKNPQRQKAKESFVTRATELHLGKYLYTKVEYVTNKDPVIITCRTHGDFVQSPDNHLANHGCRKCQYVEVAKKNSTTQEAFIEQAIATHGDVYDYSLVNYVNSNTKVKIMLSSGEVAEQLPSHHLQGFKPSLEPRGLDYQGSGILYYLKVTLENQVLYKIGITSKSIGARFNVVDLCKIEVLRTQDFETMRDAFNKEQSLLKQHKNYQYTGPNILTSGGNTELFTTDVLNLDKGNEK